MRITLDHEGDNEVVAIDGFGIVFIEVAPDERKANIRVYDGFDIMADVVVSLVKDR